MGVDFCEAGPQEGADEILDAFEFGLEDDKFEVCFWVRVTRLVFNELDL